MSIATEMLAKSAMNELAQIRKLLGWQHEDETLTEAVQRVISQRDKALAELEAAIEYVQQ